MTPKLRYSDRHMGPVRETFFLTTPAVPVVKLSRGVQLMGKKRYDADGESGGDLIAQMIEAISQTEEWQFLRKLMNEQPGTAAGGEVAAEETTIPAAVDPESEYREKMSAYNRIGQDAAETLHYELPRETDTSELHQRKREAHGEACQAYDTFVESRREIADAAAELAMARSCSYQEALTALGETLPSIRLLPSHVA